ncbi:MAG: patatin-like phospholipase family protein [Acidobacteriota bacterium]
MALTSMAPETSAAEGPASSPQPAKPLRHALVFSGGGADGAYEVGVAKALLSGKCPTTDGQPLDPVIFTGTSIGSFNASYLVSQWDEYGPAAVGNLERVWLERLAWKNNSNGGFRIRLNPLDFLDPRSYLRDPLGLARNAFGDTIHLGWQGARRLYNLASGQSSLAERLIQLMNLSDFVSPTPWAETLQDEIDYERIRTSSRLLHIIATNWRLGIIRCFQKEDMTDKLGPQSIRASSSVPGLYPVAPVGAQEFVDGAVLMNTPLKPAILDGADVLHVIYMNTDVKNMPLDDVPSTLETLYRTQIIAWASAVDRDIDRVEMYNKLYAIGDEAMDKIRQDPHLEDALKVIVEKVRQQKEAGRTYRKITVHRYFPPDGLDGALGFLDLRRSRIERLIDEGFHNTVYHDCKANSCVLAEDH